MDDPAPKPVAQPGSTVLADTGPLLAVPAALPVLSYADPMRRARRRLVGPGAGVVGTVQFANLLLLLQVIGPLSSGDDPDPIALPLVASVNIVLCLGMQYQFWKALPPHCRDIRPEAAAGLLAVPVFNIYWLFVSLVGLARGYAAFSREFPGLGIRDLGRLAWVTSSLTLIVAIASVYYGWESTLLCVPLEGLAWIYAALVVLHGVVSSVFVFRMAWNADVAITRELPCPDLLTTIVVQCTVGVAHLPVAAAWLGAASVADASRWLAIIASVGLLVLAVMVGRPMHRYARSAIAGSSSWFTVARDYAVLGKAAPGLGLRNMAWLARAYWLLPLGQMAVLLVLCVVLARVSGDVRRPADPWFAVLGPVCAAVALLHTAVAVNFLRVMCRNADRARVLNA